MNSSEVLTLGTERDVAVETRATKLRSGFPNSDFRLKLLTASLGVAAVFLWGNFIHKRLDAMTSDLPSGRFFLETTASCQPSTLFAFRSPVIKARDNILRIELFNPQMITQIKHLQAAIRAGFNSSWQTKPVQLEFSHKTRVSLALIRGGRPVSLLSQYRIGVSDFVSRSGALAGINGAFFVDASLSGTNNTLIGPAMTESQDQFQAEQNPDILERIQKRPLVLWNAKRIAIVAFQSEIMNSSEMLKLIVPDFKNAFLGGAWILKHGRVFSDQELLERPAPQDVNDVRPRVFFGVTAHGELVLGASLNPTSSSDLAGAALAAGVREAVLLDSGYSTSLVYQDKIIAVGRHNATVPSRPVPHAIVVMDDFKNALRLSVKSKTSETY